MNTPSVIKSILVPALLLCCIQGHAQLQNSWWYVGQGSGLKFDIDGPTLQDSTTMGFDDGSTTVSDSLGNLLFYTNGCKLYNRMHQPMSGNSSMPCTLSGHGPGPADSLHIGSYMINGVLAFNVPGSSSKYYLFTYGIVGPWWQQVNGIYYQVIDMTLDGGLGGVETPANRVAYTFDHGDANYKFAAVRHANGRDWWLLAVSDFNTAVEADSLRLDRLLFTTTGIADTLTTLLPGVTRGSYSEIAVSPSGTKIAFAAGQVSNSRDYLYATDFDRCTGAVGALSKLDSVPYDSDLSSGNFWFGVCFAPHRNDLLYGGSPSKLYQYRLDTLSNAAVQRNTVGFNTEYCATPLTTCWYMGQLEQGIDDKIYQIVETQNYWDIPVSDTMTKKLHYVENPDSLFPAAQYKTTPPILHKPALAGLPNQVNWNLGKLPGSECDTLHTSSNALVDEKLIAQLFPNPASTEATLVLSKPASQAMELVLYDVVGKEGLRIRVPQNQKYVQLDLSGLSEGVYFYRLGGSGKQTLNGKLVVLSKP